MYAVLHPRNYFAQAAVQNRPDLRKQPFVVLDGEMPEEFVFAANGLALRRGIELGMSRIEAESLEVVTLRRNATDEQSAEVKLHEIACRFSPRIEAVIGQPGTYALDIGGMDALFGNADQLANKLRQSAMTAGFVANAAAAGNFHAAVMLAWGRAGVTIVPPGDEPRAIASLPLSVLPIEEHHAETFKAWGIRTCGELASLAEADLIARLGQAGRKLHALACGTWPHHMTPIEESFEASLVERMDLEFPIEDLERLLFLFSRMIHALLERVREKALAIASIRAALNLDGGSRHERTIRPALPLQDSSTLLKLLQLDFETHPPSAPIVSVELQAQSALPHRGQHGLFLPQMPEPGQTEVLLAKLRKLLGENRVGSPELTDDHRPNAFRMAPFRPSSLRRSEYQVAEVPVALRVSRPPQSIAVQLVNQRPARLYWNSEVHEVREAAGPVRVSGQWWSEASWCREEWDVRLATNTAERVCRIAFDPRSRCWYVQGTYD